MNQPRVINVLLAAMVVLAVAGCNEGEGDQADRPEVAEAAFCEEHQIAEAQCPYCDPSLIESLGYCNGHDVPEAFCYQCNPALIPAFKAVGDWCAGHDRPESQCYICNPELDPGGKDTPVVGGRVGEAPSEPAPMGFISRRQQPPVRYCSKQGLTVRLENPDIAENAGLEFATVTSRLITKTVECNAEIAFDGNRYVRLSTQVPGIVVGVHKDLGDRVGPGEALATITSTHLGAAKASYLQAEAAVELWQKNHARESDLLNRGVSTEKDLFAAETRLTESRIAYSEAEQALLSFGISSKQIEDIRRTGDTSATYLVLASLPGVVVDRNAAIGELVDPSKPLFSIADVSRMWALIDIYESDLREIQVGQPVVLQVEGLPGEAFAGYITWVSSQLDPQTRTLKARAECDNTHGLLRAHMFAHASVSVRDRQQALVVPEASVQWEGCCNVVFVKKSETEYEPRKVHLGIGTGTVYEVLAGVSEGEVIVTQGSFLLKTEILKGSIGAGCCEIDPGT